MQTQEIGFFEVSVAIVVFIAWAISSSKANQIRGAFLNPYVLKNASKSEKRSLSLKLTLMQFGVFAVFVFIVPFVVQGSVVMRFFNGLLEAGVEGIAAFGVYYSGQAYVAMSW